MDINSIPGRASDAGPESKPVSRNMQYSLAMDDAADYVRDAERMYRDNLTVQTKLRVELIDRAIEELQRARDVA